MTSARAWKQGTSCFIKVYTQYSTHSYDGVGWRKKGIGNSSAYCQLIMIHSVRRSFFALDHGMMMELRC